MLRKSLGCRTRRSGTTFSLERHTTKRGIGKVFLVPHSPIMKLLTNSHLVVYQCALERDLELFDAGDATEVGEKGLTLR